MTLQRRTPLRGGGPIHRTSPLRSSGRRSAPRGAPHPERPKRPQEPPAWPLGPLRVLVIERAEHRCDRCALQLVGRPYSLQHRRARGAGGRRGHVLDTPWNLVLLCGSGTTGCHGLIENQLREQEGYAKGFAIRGELVDPADVPILRHGRAWVIPSVDDAGRGVWVPAAPL